MVFWGWYPIVETETKLYPGLTYVDICMCIGSQRRTAVQVRLLQ